MPTTSCGRVARGDFLAVTLSFSYSSLSADHPLQGVRDQAGHLFDRCLPLSRVEVNVLDAMGAVRTESRFTAAYPTFQLALLHLLGSGQRQLQLFFSTPQ